MHATQAEDFLNGKNLDKTTINGVMEKLEAELKPNEHAPDATPQYRKTLAQSLLYKVRESAKTCKIIRFVKIIYNPSFRQSSQYLENLQRLL